MKKKRKMPAVSSGEGDALDMRDKGDRFKLADAIRRGWMVDPARKSRYFKALDEVIDDRDKLFENPNDRTNAVMGANRIELSGFDDTMRDRLKAYGLFHEIISWKLRMFVPTDASGVETLNRVLDRYPVERVGEREAA